MMDLKDRLIRFEVAVQSVIWRYALFKHPLGEAILPKKSLSHTRHKLFKGGFYQFSPFEATLCTQVFKAQRAGM